MKTSILVSTFTVLYSLLTFAGTPFHHNDANKNPTLISKNPFMLSPPCRDNETQKRSTRVKKVSTEKIVVPIYEDFHYLKFEVASYVKDNEMPTEDISANTFDYLKFIVPQGAAYNDLTPDITELPVNRFEYLKFDVRNYSDNPALNSL